jgi:hypothetical protein
MAHRDMPERIDDAFIGHYAIGDREIVPRLREIVGHVFLLTSPRHGRA